MTHTIKAALIIGCLVASLPAFAGEETEVVTNKEEYLEAVELITAAANLRDGYQIEGVDDKAVQAAAETMGKLKPVVDEECKKTNQEGCLGIFDANERLKAAIKGMEQRDKETARAATAQGKIDDACEALKNMRYAQSVVDKEKEIGKVSGTMNVLKLHAAGTTVIQRKDQIQELSAAYQAQTHKSLDLKICRK